MMSSPLARVNPLIDAETVNDDSDKVSQLFALCTHSKEGCEVPEGFGDRNELEQPLKFSRAWQDRPYGTDLQITHSYGLRPWVTLVTRFSETITPSPVPSRQLPQRNRHPEIKRFLTDADWQYVSKELLPRAASLLYSITVESTNRGWTVIPAQDINGDHRTRRESLKWHLHLQVRDHVFRVRIKEIPAPGPAKYEELTWEKRYKLPDWQQTRGAKFTGSGKLELIVDGRGFPYLGKHLRETKSKLVEDRLTDLFHEIVLAVHNLEQDRKLADASRARAEAREAAIREIQIAKARRNAWRTQFAAFGATQRSVVQDVAFMEELRLAVKAAGGDKTAERVALIERAIADTCALDPLSNLDIVFAEPAIEEPKSRFW